MTERKPLRTETLAYSQNIRPSPYENAQLVTETRTFRLKTGTYTIQTRIEIHRVTRYGGKARRGSFGPRLFIDSFACVLLRIVPPPKAGPRRIPGIYTGKKSVREVAKEQKQLVYRRISQPRRRSGAGTFAASGQTAGRMGPFGTWKCTKFPFA